MRDAGRRSQVAGYRLQVAGYRSQATGRRSQVADFVSRILPVSLSPCLRPTPSPLHPVTLSPCLSVTPSPRHLVTPSPRHLFIAGVGPQRQPLERRDLIALAQFGLLDGGVQGLDALI